MHCWSKVNEKEIRILKKVCSRARQGVSWVAMPNCVLACSSCGTRRSFLIDEFVLPDVRNGQRVQKYCPNCRGATYWTFVLEERRGGWDRRQGGDRRSPD